MGCSVSILFDYNYESAYFTLCDASHILLWRVILWYKEITLVVLISHCTIYPTHSYTESFHDITKYSAIAYLTLHNDSHTTCNTVSLIWNVCIREAIVLAKKRNLPWYNKILLLSSSYRYRMHVFLSQFWSEKIIQHQCNEVPLFVSFTCHTISRFRLWNEVISLNEITQGVFISRYTIIPPNSYWESFYDISKWLWECLSHVVQWVPHTHTGSYFMI